jgi:uncharacterized protein (TIGR03437 family)
VENSLKRTALLFLFPLIAFADLTQTVTLSTSGQTNLNLDTGAASTSGGDIQWSASGITPQGSATAVNQTIFFLPSSFASQTEILVQLYPGYSKALIPASTLAPGAGIGSTDFEDLFYVHTNGNHYAKVLVTAETSTTITLMFTTFGVTGSGSGTGGPPTIAAIENNSSYVAPGLPNYGIAPSSIFVVFGTGLADPGAVVLQSSTAPGLPLTLNGASISVTVNGVTTHPPIYYTSPTQLAAVLPASTPVGTGTITVTYKGVASNAAPIRVVAAALGIDTYNTNSAVATDAVSYAILSYTNSGTPGENIVLWTSGLGADRGDSDNTFSSTPHAVDTPLQIYIGGKPANILYQGSAGYPGVDQINITIPTSVPNGCWITLAAVSGGVLSNIATLPINSGGGACVDPVNGLSGNQVAPLGSRTLRTGLVDIGQTMQLGVKGTTLSTFTDAAFEKYTGIYTPANQVSPGGCIVNNPTPVTLGTITGLDPGNIQLTGPGGISLMLANQLGIKGAFYGTLAAGAIPQTGGAFVFKGSGGADVGSFTSTLTFSNPLLNWTNESAAATIDRSQDFKATWTGGNPGSYVFVTGVSTLVATATTKAITIGFTCLAKADDGQFTVPSYILSALPPGIGGVGIQNDIYEPLPASGLDIGMAQGEIGIGTRSTYK